jgi:hypothetical protein
LENELADYFFQSRYPKSKQNCNFINQALTANETVEKAGLSLLQKNNSLASIISN